MRIGLAGGNDAIVTALASALGFIVINGGRGHPGRGHVTGITHITGENMRRALARGNHAIVTGLAGADDLVVIHCGGGRPYGRAMTDFTQSGGVDVRGGLTTCRYTIVTGDTGCRGGGMIEGRHRPVIGRMTSLAGLAGRHVSR